MKEENTSNRSNPPVPGEAAKPEPMDAREVRYLEVRRATNFIWLLTGILQGLFGLRLILKFIGANPESPFAGFIYTFTEPFLFLFQGLTDNPAFENFVLEIHVIFAMAFYALVAWVIIRLVWLIFYRPEDIQ